jgi:hypothetical protein
MKGWLTALLLLALAAGTAGGLCFTWILAPVEIRDSAPSALRDGDKLVYAMLIGDLYAFEGDLERAQARLAGLGLPADGAALAPFVEQYLQAGGRPEEVRSLAYLAQDLGASGGMLAVFARPSPQPPMAPTAGAFTAGPAATPSPWPTATPPPTFLLAEHAQVCAAPGRPGLIAVWVRDVAGRELAGVQVLVSWPGGQDRFWTGLRPELGAGYADFQMAPGTRYDVSLAAYPGEVAQGLESGPLRGRCDEGVDAMDWRLVFQQVP